MYYSFDFWGGSDLLTNNSTSEKSQSLATNCANIVIISSRFSDKLDDIIWTHGRRRNCGFALSRLAKSSPGKIRRDFYKEIDKFGGANPQCGEAAG